jgi:biotin carboxyl carrier protein
VKLQLKINGADTGLELLAPPPGCRFRFDGGAERQAQVETAEPGVYSVLMDGRSYEARVEATGRGLVVVIDGHRFEVDVSDPRGWSRKAAGPDAGGAETVAAPMPGKVVRVLVAAGDTVEAGQGLVVVEAMKMQNELKAGRAGRVATLPAREGATVAAGEVLATIE